MRTATVEDDFLATALRCDSPVAAVGADVTDDTECLVPALALLLGESRDRLRTGLAAAGVADDIAAAADTALLRTLGRRLTRIAARTLVYELHASGLDFLQFVTRCGSAPGLAALLDTYPVLGRLLARTCRNNVEAVTELATRVHADRDALADLLPGAGTAVRELRMGSGDVHRGGRTVAMVVCDGGTVVYKPRSLDAAAHVARFFALLSARRPDLRLTSPRTVRRDGYGWEEFVAAEACTDDAALARFYLRHGALLALMYVLDATDLHCQNIVAHGEYPVVVDAETLFHPSLPGPDAGADPAANEHRDSVLRTGLLPLLVRGEHGLIDLSALCGGRAAETVEDVVRFRDPGTVRMRLERVRRDLPASDNVARGRDGQPCEPDAVHVGAVVAGFRAAYGELLACRAALADLVRDCARDEVRVVLRPTQLYATLLDELTHPDLLRDPARYDNALSSVRSDDDHPALRALAAAEAADLLDADVPLFVTTAGSRILTGTRPGHPDATLADSGVERALRRLDRLDTADMQRQLWFVEAGFAGRGQPVEHRPVPGRATTPGSRPIEAEQLLAQACALGDELLSNARPDATGRINWVGLEPADGQHWELRPMGAGLADGYTGVAVFLADLARATGIDRFREHARAAISGLGTLVRRLDDDPDMATAIGDDPFVGLGGVHAALVHLTERLDDADLADWTATCAAVRRRLPHAAEPAPAVSLGSWCYGVPALLTTREPARMVAALRADGALNQHSLCHGELGVLETLRLACPPGREPDPAIELLRRERLAAVMGEIVTRGVRCGTVDCVRTPGLLHGIAGVGLALVNQAFAHTPHTACTPSFDLLRAVRPENARLRES